MLTKYIIKIDDQEHELTGAEVKNWDEIKCSFKRSDLGGVVRSFTSQFEFVGEAYDLLLALYLRDGLNAQSAIDILVMNDQWVYNKLFSCPFDFSSISWTSTVLKIGCVDTSIASLIKANKSTKYDFIVGTDIVPDDRITYNRIPVLEDATYSYTGGTSHDDGSLTIDAPKNDGRVYMGLSSESHLDVGFTIHTNDDQTDEAGSYLFKALKNVSVKLDFDITYDFTGGPAKPFKPAGCYVVILRENGSSEEVYSRAISGNKLTFVGQYTSRAALEAEYPPSSVIDINGAKPYWAIVDNSVYTVYYKNSFEYGWVDQNVTEEEFRKRYVKDSTYFDLAKGDRVCIKTTDVARLYKSEFKFSWYAKGSPVDFNSFKAETVLKALLAKMCNKDIDVEISQHDYRLPDIRLVAAESIREIQQAKLSSSFSEFCEWMSAVFGYVYYLDETQEGNPIIRFLHRSELFSNSDTPRTIQRVRDVTYSINTSLICSSVEVGYDKKEYDSVVGRDEVNFSTKYTTGCTVSDKTLSLKSKYRADSYGVEFAVLKRGKDSSDSSSDKDVFFIHCEYDSKGILRPSYAKRITTNMSTEMFNAAVAPIFCVEANEDLIGVQGEQTRLTFASATGHTYGFVAGISLDCGHLITSSFATCGEVQFTTDDISIPTDLNELIEISYQGVTYRGYLTELDLKFAKSEAAKYKLIVKSIQA